MFWSGPTVSSSFKPLDSLPSVCLFRQPLTPPFGMVSIVDLCLSLFLFLCKNFPAMLFSACLRLTRRRKILIEEQCSPAIWVAYLHPSPLVNSYFLPFISRYLLHPPTPAPATPTPTFFTPSAPPPPCPSFSYSFSFLADAYFGETSLWTHSLWRVRKRMLGESNVLLKNTHTHGMQQEITQNVGVLCVSHAYEYDGAL